MLKAKQYTLPILYYKIYFRKLLYFLRAFIFTLGIVKIQIVCYNVLKLS